MGSLIPEYDFVVEGLEEQIKLFDQEPFIVHSELHTAMSKSVLTLEANIKPVVPVDRGRLRSGIGSEVIAGDTLTVITGRVGSSLKDEEYPQVMEFGREPGAKMPPLAAIEPWVRRVIRPEEDQVRSIAFRIARSIGKKGIQGRRYMQKGWEKSQKSIKMFFAQAVERIAERLSNGRY